MLCLLLEHRPFSLCMTCIILTYIKGDKSKMERSTKTDVLSVILRCYDPVTFESQASC